MAKEISQKEIVTPNNTDPLKGTDLSLITKIANLKNKSRELK